jgi:hypothetical protein
VDPAAIAVEIETRIARLESRADRPQRGVHAVHTAVAVQVHAARPAAKGRRAGVELEVGRVRTVKIPLGRALQPRHRVRAPGDLAAGDPAGHHPIAFGIQEVVRVGAGDVRLIGQPGPQGRDAQIAVDRGGNQAERAAPLFTLHAPDEIVGERFDLGPILESAGDRLRPLAAGHGFE